MKKTIALLLIITMFAAIACMTASAEIRFYDPFDTWTSYWIGYNDPAQGGDLNVITKVNGENVLEGWEEARVHQGDYSNDDIAGVGYANAGSALTTGTFWIDLRCEDTGNEANAGLWWKNTYHEKHEGATASDTYTLFYDPTKGTVRFNRDFPGASTDEEKIIVEWTDPKGRGNNINGNPITLGMRVESGKISAFVDGECIGSYSDGTLGIDPCPILLWNNGLHAIWDNFYVGDLNELQIAGNGGNNDGGNNGGNGGNGGGNETIVVTDTDESGNIVTRIETRPAANNGGAATGGNAAKTGDSVVIVIAVMIVSIGAAVVVKKVTSK